MLKLESLSKKFNSFTAVDNINICLNKGELFGFLGPNGAGKTTTIKMIVGLFKPTEGSIYIDGVNISTNNVEAKRKIGYIPDQPYLYDKLTGKEFLLFCGGLFDVDKNKLKQKIEELIELLKIENWLNKRTEEYSQGMRQRISIASALLHDPPLVVIDEPMIGLDPQSTHIIKNVFKEYVKSGRSIFMSTHSLNVAEEISSRVCIINRGKIIFDDTSETLQKLKDKHEKNIEDLFIELTKDENNDSIE
ncbi:MAG: ABC transporter [Ignavibacteriae bacterium HGW-Ignavibacteriae-2]|jgi:ABC-2 type transport system ATP-binding protein|nr:MAG: ABC transporter [Ignavibacteriae bacterium HGW-Ignavibacteriae-2]